MRMGHGFRSAVRLVATVAAAAAVVRVASGARHLLSQPAPPRHRAPRPPRGWTDPPRPASLEPVPTVVAPVADLREAEALARRAFGPELCIVPSRGSGITTPPTAVIELEASGELDGEPSPTERLLARRHAGDVPAEVAARDAPTPIHRYG
jgi:hypothetical protein